MKTKLLAVCIVYLSCILNVTGQAVNEVIPPSPNAAALGTYGDIPVGYYTGIPNINIPLYEIVSGDIKLPISLSYHASGIKVAQEASWVGLGWALNAGGCITRSIRGWDDFDITNPYGFVMKGDLPEDSVYTISLDLSTTAVSVLYPPYVATDSEYGLNDATIYDSEPDIFYYNFGNYSGKIMLSNDGVPVVVNQDPLKIERFSNGGMTIITPDGCSYYFGTTEETAMYDYLPSTNYARIRGVQPYVDNTWYLDSIVSPQNKRITFNYDTTKYCTKSQIAAVKNTGLDAGDQRPCISWVFPAILNNDIIRNAYTFDGGDNNSFSFSYTDEVLLSKIIFDGGSIKFETQDRSDLIANSATPQSLNSLIIYNELDSIVNSYSFSTSYFNSGDNTLIRLKLDSIIDLSGKQHSFSYNSSESLPSKISSAYDHWGYYNGADDNNNIDTYAALPTIKYQTAGSTAIYVGADREASEDEAQAAILTRIDYPTGGYTSFDYELNDFNNDYETIGYNTITETYSGSGNDIITLDTITGISLKFTYTKNGSDCPWVAGTCDSLYNAGVNVDCYVNYLEILQEQSDGSWSTIEEYAYRDIDCLENSPVTTTYRKTLAAGRYQILYNTTYYASSFSCSCVLNYAYHSSSNSNKGGGLRIKSISSSDGENTYTTSYDYTMEDNGETVSSGILMSAPRYHYTLCSDDLGGQRRLVDGRYCNFNNDATYITYTLESGNVATVDVSSGSYTKASSNTIKPLGNSAQGNPVGYSKVTETKQSGNGKTVYYFSNCSEINPFNYYYEYAGGYVSALNFPGVPDHVFLSNGQLLKKEFWNSDSQLLKEEIHSYERQKFIITRGIKFYSIGQLVFEDVLGYTTPPTVSDYLVRYYDNIAERWNLVKDSTVTYSYSGSAVSSIKEVNTYEYGNYIHRQVTRKTSGNSNGDNIIIDYKYPADIDTTTSVYASMTSLNMLTYPVEQTTQVNGQVTGSSLTTYKSGGGSYVPDEMYSLEIQSPLASPLTPFNGDNTESIYGTTPEMVFNNYDSKGNILQITGKDGIVTSYLWDSNRSYPMAKVVNASYSQISSQDGMICTYNSKTLYNSLNSLVPGAVISTYSYKPLVGMSSQTDQNGKTTHYDYDDFGRLKMVKDDSENIVKKYEYHYKN